MSSDNPRISQLAEDHWEQVREIVRKFLSTYRFKGRCVFELYAADDRISYRVDSRFDKLHGGSISVSRVADSMADDV